MTWKCRQLVVFQNEASEKGANLKVVRNAGGKCIQPRDGGGSRYAPDGTIYEPPNPSTVHFMHYFKNVNRWIMRH